MGARCHNLANTIEQYVCGVVAALCQITLITCCHCHGLRGSASRVLVNSDWACRWEGQNLIPTELTPVNQSSKNLSQVITSVTPTVVPNLVQIRPRASVQMGEFIYRFFGGNTFRLDPSMDLHV